ncbi:hypothetical protein CYFUS_003876 [Cystobacter fuscus]|uniref:Glycosyltransferase RgtA/B/C/D-like domain-containing protein n=1 Tax=Cystobacter fuscus TaxID=43 RepID=A0A250J4X4_9BACT|nr:hypothetical protein [Cystobacter fuscus]ATB38441.1 hypothetical protein CYFUS_003876 [Cystobacter fuscus]
MWTRPRLAIAASVGVFLVHLALVWHYAVDIPYWDEWEMLRPEAFPSEHLSLDWLFARHNEHRIVTTKLVHWLFFRLSGWNHIGLIVFNFLFFGLLLLAMARLMRRAVPDLPVVAVMAFLLFLQTPLNYENHLWGFQLQFHFLLLMLCLGIMMLFDEQQRSGWLVSGAVLLVMGAYSFSSGITAGLAAMGVFVGFKALRALRAQDTATKPRELAQLGAAGLITLAGIAAAALGQRHLDGHPEFTLPHQSKFWVYLVNLVGLGFGFEQQSELVGTLCLLAVVVPVGWLLLRSRLRLTSAQWMLVAMIAAVGAALATITLGRAGFGVVSAKSSRYMEIAFLLVPLTAAIWWSVLEPWTKARRTALVVLWTGCLIGAANDVSLKYYRAQRDERMEGVACARQYYLNGGEANCGRLYPVPIPERLDRARQLKLSFVEDILARQELARE